MRPFHIWYAEIMNLPGVVTAVTGCAVVVTGGAGVVTPGGTVFAVVTIGVKAVVIGCIVAVEMNI